MSKNKKKLLSMILVFIMIFSQGYDVLAKANIAEGITKASGIISGFNLASIIKINDKDKAKDKNQAEYNDKVKKSLNEAKERNTKKGKNISKDGNIPSPNIEFVKSINGKTNLITWNKMLNAEYELEVDGKIINMKSNTAYFHRDLKDNEEHSYRIRAKSNYGISDWSSKITKRTESETKNKNKALKVRGANEKSNKLLLTGSSDSLKLSKTVQTDVLNESTKSSYTLLAAAEEYSEMYLTKSINRIGKGWLGTDEDETIGDPGDIVDAVKLKLNNAPYGVKVKYRGYVEGIGWQPWVYDDAVAGVFGKQLQAIEAKIVQVTDGNVEKDAEGLSIQYLLYCSDFSNINIISKDGETSGVPGKASSAIMASVVNSAEYIRSVIDKDTRWTLSGSPYVIPGELIINQNVKLEIDPGVKVVFQKYASRRNGIEVNGTLIANGTASDPINFTYSEDGTLVSENNYTYIGITITPTGEFTGNYIKFEQKGLFGNHINSKGKLTLNNSTINTVNPNDFKVSRGIELESSKDINIQNTNITNCESGIFVKNISGVVNIQNNKINDNRVGISVLLDNVSSTAQINIKDNSEINRNEYGINIPYKSSKIAQLSIINNKIDSSKNSGIYFDGSNSDNIMIQKNTITNTNRSRQYSSEGPIYIRLNNIKGSASTFLANLNSNDVTLKNNLSLNNYDAIMITGGINDNLYIPKGSNNYLVDYSLYIPEGKIVDVEPGAVLNLRGFIWTEGRLNAEGKSSAPIIFTSVADSANGITHTAASGYEVNRDNNFEAIYVFEKGEFRGTNIKVRYGGRNYNEQDSNYPTNLKVWGKATLINSEIGESLTDGIFGSGNLTVINSKIYNCAENGISALGALTLTNSVLTKNKNGLIFSASNAPATLVTNSFISNMEYGLWNVSDITINAQYNYWGSQYGPSYFDWDNTLKWIINGDKVNGKVNYKPYLATEYKANLGDEFNQYINTVEYRTEKHFGTDGANASTGNFSKAYEDLASTFADFDIKLTRTYNSMDAKDGIMGKGWTFGFQGDISDYTNGSGLKSKVIKLPNGSVQSFRENSDGTYTANDSRNQLSKLADNTFVLTTKDQYKYSFNSNGKLIGIKDRNDNAITIQLSDDGKISKVVDGTGRSFSLNYVNGLVDNIVETVNGTTGRTIKYSYTNGLLSTATDSIGNIITYEYDTNKQLCKIKDKSGNILEAITYFSDGDDKGKIKEHKDIFGNNNVYTYDNANKRTLITDSNNKITEQWYDNERYTTFTVNPDRTVSFAEYYLEDGINKYGETKSETDRNRVTYQYERDDRGNTTKIINPDLSHKDFTYDDKNNLIKEADESGKLTFYIYDAAKNNLIKKIQPLDGISEYKSGVDESKYAITTYSYYSDEESNQLGYKVKALLKSTTDPEGNIIVNTYDPNGNIKTAKNQEGKITTFEYDSLGFKKSALSPKQYKTDYVYDKNGNLEKTVFNGGETNRITYDSFGRKVKEIDAKLYDSSLDDLTNHVYNGDHGTRYSYFVNGKLQWVKDAENNQTSYEYDLYGNISKETKPNGAVYTYEYDDMNRVTKAYFKENASTSAILLEENVYTILSDGVVQKANKKYISDNEAAMTYYTYDYANRLIDQKNADNTIIKIKYNTNGTKNSEVDENGNTTYYEYDGLNRLVKKWVPFEVTDGIKKYTYTETQYNKIGNKLIEKTGKDAIEKDKLPSSYIITTNSYYKDGKLKSSIDDEGRKKDYFYDDDGYLSSEHKYIDSKNKVVIDYTNNYFGKPVSKVEYVQAGDIYGNTYTDTTEKTTTTKYTYDKNGNVETIATPTLATADGSQYDSIVTTYAYDKMNRKISESQPGKDENGNNVILTETTAYNWEGKQNKTTDSLNHTTQYIYNQRGALEKVIDAKGGVTAYYYDRAGRKIAEVSPKNYDAAKSLSQMERSEFTYDLMNRVKTKINKFNESKVDTSNFQWVSSWTEIVSKAYKYDSKGNVIKELDALGYESGTGATVDEKINSGYGIEYTYNAAGKLLTKLDAASKDLNIQYTSKFAYDALGRLISETNAKGVITIKEYDNANNIKKIKLKKSSTDSEKIIETREYDFLNRMTSQTDGNGNTTTYVYNVFNKPRKVVYPGDDTIPENIVEYQYDVLGNLKKQKNSIGTINIYTYDNQGRVLSEKVFKDNNEAATSITTSVKYDKLGNKRFEYDGNGSVKENTFDELNRLKTTKVVTTDIDGIKTTRVTTYNYDSNGNEISVTDWRNNTYAKVYDGINRVIEKRDPYASIQKLEYNHNNAQNKSYDALNNVTEYQYDKNNRLLATIDGEKHVTSQTYDIVGNIGTKRDGKNHTTTFEYNEFNKLSKVTNTKGETSIYSYDLNGNLLTQTDGKGNITTFEYNAADKARKRIDHGGRLGSEGSYTYKAEKVESYIYYADGSLKEKVDRNGKNTKYEYNILGKPTLETVGNISIAHTYDKNGNELTITDSTGTTSRSYDELNRVISKNVSKLGLTKFKYDIITSRSDIPQASYGETTIDPKGNVTTKVFDKAGRVRYVVDGDINGAINATYDYYNNGNTKSLVYSGGTKEEYTYYANNTLKSLSNKKADGTIIETFSYEYDAANNQTKKTDRKGVTTYSYDELNRLETVTEPTNKATKYTYDKAGNRASQVITQNGSIVSTTLYNYNEQNRLLSAGTIQGVFADTVPYSYDNNGNLLYKGKEKLKPSDGQTEAFYASVAGETENDISKDVVINEYDELNRLTKSLVGGKTNSYEYNGEGLRVGKTVDGQTTNYLYEEDKIILELDASGNQKARNIYGTNAVSRKVEGAAQKYFYLYNGHGDVTTLTDGGSNILATYYYDAFGTPTESTGNVDNPIRYAGYQYDQETGNYYLLARMYDPTIARFLQEDTYRGDINDPLSLNLYSYCHNEPIMYSDPSGHFNLFSKDDWVGLYNKGKQAVTQVVNTVGSFISNPIETLSKANEKYIKPFIENTLGISKDNKVYKAVKYVGTRAAGIAANITNVARDTLNLKNRMTGIYTDIPSAALSQANIEIKNKLGLIDAQTYTNLKQRNLEIINDNISFVKDFYSNLIPETINGIKNDFITTLNIEKAKDFFFNPNASLKSVAEYEMSAFNTVTLVSTAGNFAQAGIRAGISRIESSAIRNIGISETSLAMSGDNVGSLMNGTKTGPFEMNLQVFRKKGAAEAESNLRFTQTTASPYYSAEGKFAGKTIGEVSDMLRSGELKASEVPVTYIERDGTRLIENTRSSLALKRANIPESEWTLINKTGDPTIEAKITERLERNGLTNSGTDVLRITGEGKNASSLK